MCTWCAYDIPHHTDRQGGGRIQKRVGTVEFDMRRCGDLRVVDARRVCDW